MKAAFVAIVLVSLPVMSFADASLKSQIAAMNKPVDAALRSRDINAFTKAVTGGMTPDFKYIDDGAKPQDFNGMIAGMKQGLSMYQKVTKIGTTVISVKQMGDSGRAVEKHVMEGLVAGPDKKPHKMVFIGTSTETYRRVKGKWMMASMSMKTDKMTVDGKSTPMR